MSKKIITLSLFAAVSVAAFSGNANAVDYSKYTNGITPYFSISSQYLFPGTDRVRYNNNTSAKSSNNDGFAVNAAVGAKFDNYRAELEYGYLYNSVDGFNSTPASDVTTGVSTYMVNGYYDFKNSSPVTPYLGAGIGAAHGKFEQPGFEGSDTVIAYQLMTGASYALNKNNSLYAGYRFTQANDFNLDTSKVAYKRHAIEAGYRFSF